MERKTEPRNPDPRDFKSGDRKPGDRKPIQEFKVQLSEDGRYWLFRDITTWIVPVNYLAAIAQNNKSRADIDRLALENIQEGSSSRNENDRSS